MKRTIYMLIGFLAGTVGSASWIIFYSDVIGIKELIHGVEIRVCNNSPFDFEDIQIIEGPYFMDVRKSECSLFAEGINIYEKVSLSIVLFDGGIRKRYSYTLIDTVGMSYLSKGRYTIYIENIIQDANYTIEYHDAVQFNTVKE